jgi:hypothetical protein
VGLLLTPQVSSWDKGDTPQPDKPFADDHETYLHILIPHVTKTLIYVSLNAHAIVSQKQCTCLHNNSTVNYLVNYTSLD